MMVIEENLRLGGDPQAHEQSAVLTAELAKLNHPARPDIDWARAERSCMALFREHGAELQSAVAFTLARAQLHGVQGLDDGLSLIARLLDRDWDRLWPPALPIRLEALAWLFAQLQPWLRGMQLSGEDVPGLRGLQRQLKRLSELLACRGATPFPALEALRSQLQGVLKRLAPDAVAPVISMATSADPAAEPSATPIADIVPPTPLPVSPTRRRAPRKARSDAPAVVVPKVDSGEPPVEQASARKRRPVWAWLLLLGLLIALTVLLGWAHSSRWWPGGKWAGDQPLPSAVSTPVLEKEPPVAPASPVRLDGQLLFPPGKAELKPGSTKVLINSLIDIKAQPGWLIVITGHSDSTGDAQRNLELSRARAQAVREWMQQMGDIPDDCFEVRGAGSSEPVASDDTQEGRNANRRVEIILTPVGGVCQKQ